LNQTINLSGKPMEILAIVILCGSVLASFSTTERKSKAKTNQRDEQDADLQFTEAYEVEVSPSKK
jgi:hypothetical protein